MEPEKTTTPEEPVSAHKNALPTNYKTHLSKGPAAPGSTPPSGQDGGEPGEQPPHPSQLRGEDESAEALQQEA